MTEQPTIDPEWVCPPWLADYSKRELQWLAAQLHDRNTRLQIENRQKGSK